MLDVINYVHEGATFYLKHLYYIRHLEHGDVFVQWNDHIYLTAFVC